ncbi:Uncharacterized membrane-anchored protein [Alkalithermobacter thermoalcaliphilus JW-YL-7 = DSM 7308]|uniref:GDYXXLXY protein n=1 Tax=Alkalithermobacter thermoalcaliphilus JW-YL-7 = DSM 7308 TaxID=1121328 RepID=A0A150FMS9_CLOPD|nr:GDYXXLXY protein [[Clostridium] paradoxum JW-YL-7 = DSM 7308]SHL27116.1 Uncharacterized membrane-anchored protein [[Clostridium] paradoxum JW-YL-7 = DSM 7308]
MSNFKKYILSSIFPVTILICMTILPLITYFKGYEILIQTEPYDPKDVFRGDYVVLNYKINQVEIEKLPEEFINATEDNWYKFRGKKLYAVVKKDGQFYDVDYVTFEKPKGKLFLNCRYEYPIWDFESGKENVTLKGAFLSYNLDRFFVRENTGKTFEDMARTSKLKARVKVFNGYSLLVDVF